MALNLYIYHKLEYNEVFKAHIHNPYDIGFNNEFFTMFQRKNEIARRSSFGT